MHDGFGILPDQHVSGMAMHNYLEAYARQHGLLERIKLGVKVNEVSQLPDKTWKLRTSSSDMTCIQAAKLIVATGVNNEPHFPNLHGVNSFNAPIFHSGEIGSHFHEITEDTHVQKIAVIGGGKSAYDAVYLAATHGREVEWIIRKSGKGPAWVFPAHTQKPVKIRREVSA